MEHGCAEFAMPGQAKSGDACLVKTFSDSGLITVVDGLGHGDTAYKAARTAIETINDNPGLPVTELIRKCHKAMTRTSGAAVSMASVDTNTGTMTWIGVGNVEGVLLRKRESSLICESLLLRSGVVGYQLPPLKASSIPVFPGDVLIFNTDGIRSGFNKNVNLNDSPRIIADYILKYYNRNTDDALVLVVCLNKNNASSGKNQ